MKEEELTDISQLKEWHRNPRAIDEQSLTGLKISIAEFGDLSGIVFNIRNRALVCGHQRLKALKEQHGEALRLEGNEIVTPAGEHFGIRLVDWDDTKHAAANIAANNQYIGGTYTEELASIIDELTLASGDLSRGLNFDRLKIEFEEFWKSQQIQEDVAPPLPKEPRTKLGDLYELGNHRLKCGDSTIKEDMEELMDGEKAQLIFTDPPYNVDYESASGATYASAKFGGTGAKIFNDNKSDEDCLRFYTDTLKNLHSISKESVSLYWWFAMRNVQLNRQAFTEAGWRVSQTIIWLKNSFVFAQGQEYHRCFEPCLFGWKDGQKHFSSKMFNSMSDVFSVDYADFTEQFDVWYEKRDITQHYVHPTQKPVRLAERALKKNSRPGDVVVDVFGGSGSTLIACEQLKRRCYILEMDPKYCDVIMSRHVAFTGNNDIKLNGKSIKWIGE